MLIDLLTALHESGLAAEIRHGRWLYPVVNSVHIIGVALLFGAIVPLDLRLIGAWASLPADILAKVLVPVAFGGAVIAVTSGILLFSVQPLKYSALPLFQLKMGLILCGLANALLLRLPSRRRNYNRLYG